MNYRIKALFISFSFVAALSAQRVEWVSTTDNNRWQTSNKVKLEKALAGTQFDITITGEKAQVIDGFGGCFSELGWDALMELSETERNKVIYNLFNPQEANFNYNRMPMGASDFGMNFYSFNDVADDFAMDNFSIARDRHILLRFIKAAQKENPGMHIFASPWSPPAWMKTNNHYASTASTKGFNGLPAERILKMLQALECSTAI